MEDNNDQSISEELINFVDLDSYIFDTFMVNDLMPLSEYSNVHILYPRTNVIPSVLNPVQEESFPYCVVNFPSRVLDTTITSLDTTSFHRSFEKLIDFLTEFHGESIGFTKHPKVCRGCKNYYGRKDGDNVLICAVHPYGVEGDTCIDYNA